MAGDRLRLKTKGRFLEAPILNGQTIAMVTKVEFVAGALDLPQVTIHVQPEVVFNGKAYVSIRDVVVDPQDGARTEFANALNEADLRARTKARNAAREAAGLPPAAKRRAALPESTSASALVDEMDALGWGFYRKKGNQIR